MTFSALWLQERFYRPIITRYVGVQKGSLIYFDDRLPFSDTISMTLYMDLWIASAGNDEARMYIENRLHSPHRWTCTLWLQGYGCPRRSEPVAEITGNEEQMEEDIILALLLL